jgi:hypothetical protein
MSSAHKKIVDNDAQDVLIPTKQKSQIKKKKPIATERSFLSMASSKSMHNLSLNYQEHINRQKSRKENNPSDYQIPVLTKYWEL